MPDPMLATMAVWLGLLVCMKGGEQRSAWLRWMYYVSGGLMWLQGFALLILWAVEEFA